MMHSQQSPLLHNKYVPDCTQALLIIRDNATAPERCHNKQKDPSYETDHNKTHVELISSYRLDLKLC